MIDNYDSFTYNIVQYCQELGHEINIIKNDELTLYEIIALDPVKIILSPGPGRPEDAGVTLEVINHFKDTVPIFGICLGLQSIAQVFGANIINATNLMHGKTSTISTTTDCLLFAGLPDKFIQTRYHSLVVDKNSLNENIIVTSTSLDDDEIMSIKIKDKPIVAVQFHPESILSEHGHKMIGNFLSI